MFKPLSLNSVSAVKLPTAFSAFLLPFKDCSKIIIPCSFLSIPKTNFYISILFFNDLYPRSSVNLGGANLFDPILLLFPRSVAIPLLPRNIYPGINK